MCVRHVYQLQGGSPEYALQQGVLAKSKGVLREEESERSWRQRFELTNRNGIKGAGKWVMLHKKQKPYYCMELTGVNAEAT